MEWINDLRGKTIGFDAAPLIYFIEVNNTCKEKIPALITTIDKMLQDMK